LNDYGPLIAMVLTVLYDINDFILLDRVKAEMTDKEFEKLLREQENEKKENEKRERKKEKALQNARETKSRSASKADRADRRSKRPEKDESDDEVNVLLIMLEFNFIIKAEHRTKKFKIFNVVRHY
jgi:hypothetical protein